MADQITVEVCYARPGLTWHQALSVAPGTTLQQAIVQSGILQQVPEIEINTCKVGIFSKLKPGETVLRANDRIEIYRPLLADPKTARRERVTQKRAGRKAMTA
jgi:putative ubiquitin-RnfH superfamily antitoxin RatB of RatAB toxin-antitoxin module